MAKATKQTPEQIANILLQIEVALSNGKKAPAASREAGISLLPSTPKSVALYIADRASKLASGTIARRLTSITKAHQAAGFTDSPATTRHFVVGETLK